MKNNNVRIELKHLSQNHINKNFETSSKYLLKILFKKFMFKQYENRQIKLHEQLFFGNCIKQII